jgi:ApbE superfamily uncharacterized protein (UPF0280 family)
MKDTLTTDRRYRRLMGRPDLASFRVTIQETDLLIQAESDLSDIARESIIRHRGYLENYLRDHPGFVAAMEPWQDPLPVPDIVFAMIEAGFHAGVGPMAAVAGAVAEAVGRDLLDHSTQVIVENGGDLFIHTGTDVSVAVFAGASPLSMRLAIRVAPGSGIRAVCTSSGAFGHSLSLGRADAVCVTSTVCALADAAATAIGNRISSPADLSSAVETGKNIDGVKGILAICGEEMAVWGEIELLPLPEKKLEFSTRTP